jgi:FkbM family methyltransferase
MSRLQTLFRQLRPVEFARIAAFEAVRRTVSRYATPSYAQSAEDIVIDNLLGHKASGFYVDVGCNHPISMSNTYRFYLRGWRGIAIDANAEFKELFARLRPNDIFVNSCVSDSALDVNFRIYKSRALSGVTEEKFYDNQDHYQLERIERLQTKPLNEILQTHGAPEKFELLSIDVEGHDFEVLQSIDLNHYQPEVILVEVNGRDISVGAICESNVAKHLHQYSYEPVAAHWTNIFFRKVAPQASVAASQHEATTE